MKTTTLEILALNVRRLRMQRKLSQEDFADLCGLHRTYVGGIERAERNVTIKTLDRLAEALEKNPLDLLRDGRRG
jgi:transcriptional regulator with XRE-family HTH domain